jgi:lipopolysaccharide transport system ATP-binding protein
MTDSDVVIRVEGLGKKYSLHHEQSERYTALRDVVARQAKAAGRLLNPFTLAGQLRKAQREAAQERAECEEDFWALKDVSFEIRRGERVGIIGRNGAGKSTLLKILSRITEPTTGRVELRGRVASLLEVGTGFHPELTGRENIYLNGAILGMTRREIRSKFDEIVDFSEVEKFLDTPVKRYSSGMYVRLAFAVAAHLEPEILVVDEVLAVGDMRFQEKCLGKLKSMSRRDRTVLFVSHNMEAIARTCDTALFLENGRITDAGECKKIVSQYLGNTDKGKRGPISWSSSSDDLSSLSQVTSIQYAVTEQESIVENLYKSKTYSLHIRAEIIQPDPNLIFFAAYYDQDRQLVYVSSSQDESNSIVPSIEGNVEFTCSVPVRELNAGIYQLEISCVIYRRGWILPNESGNAREFELIDDTRPPKLTEIAFHHPFTGAKRPGCLAIPTTWQVLQQNSSIT